ncbi:MAG TPA: LptF/LptG family permease [Pirellulaceae bacterium]|nr:LptF/LptG family permease [Pirellulaceae bacterium]
MGIFTRYVLAELMKVFLVALTAMSTLMMLVFLVYEAVRQGLGFEAVIRLIPYTLPHALCFAIPGTILFAVCAVYGRMSAHNEIIALKGMGIPPRAVMVPVLVLGLLLSLVTVWLNDIAFSWGRSKAYQVVLQSVEATIYGILRNQGRYDNGKISFNVLGVRGTELLQPMVVIREDADSPPRTIFAESARLESRSDEGVLIVHVERGRYEDGSLSYDFDRESIPVRLVDVTKKDRSQGSPSDYSMTEIPAEIRAQERQIEAQRLEMALQAGFQAATGDWDRMQGTMWQADALALDTAVGRLHRLETETWRRFAGGFACLCFVAVGAPLAIRMRTADVWNSFAVCFFPILIVYYPLLAFGLDRAKSGAMPPYVVWLGNLVLGLIGIALYRRMVRY